MAVISVSYAALSSGHDGLVATWTRIEGHLADLAGSVGATADMRSDALAAYLTLKQRWDAAAEERQLALKSLADLVARAGEQYRATDAQLAGMFGD